MKKGMSTLFLVLASFCLAGCGANKDDDLRGTVETSSDITSEVAETPSDEITAKFTDNHEYVHGTDGYYSLVDEGYTTPVKLQYSGTCWATAAASTMESNFLLKFGKEISIDPKSIVNAVYYDDKTSGYFMKADKYFWGGWSWMIAETLSNGFGDYTLKYVFDYNGSSIEELQAAIKEYGAVVIDVNDLKTSSFGAFDGYKTQIYTDGDEFDHASLIVGWDDNFPKEYFTTEASRDGAWLVQNTKGGSWGNHGFFWMSYDSVIDSAYVFGLTDEYEKVVAYDTGNENKISTGETTTIANKFHEPGKLKAVGTYTPVDNESATIEIYDDDKELVVGTLNVTFEQNGYHVVALDEPIDVTNYTIRIKFYGDAPVEGESVEMDALLDYKADINPGESFVCMDGEWFDLSDPQTAKALGLDFTPNNACIKALY